MIDNQEVDIKTKQETTTQEEVLDLSSSSKEQEKDIIESIGSIKKRFDDIMNFSQEKIEEHKGSIIAWMSHYIEGLDNISQVFTTNEEIKLESQKVKNLLETEKEKLLSTITPEEQEKIKTTGTGASAGNAYAKNMRSRRNKAGNRMF